MPSHRSERLTLLYSRDEIAKRVRELGAAIEADYAGGELVLIGVLRGAFVFLADLIRHLTVPVVIDFIGAVSYGNRTETSGQVTITKNLQVPITGRDVLLGECLVEQDPRFIPFNVVQHETGGLEIHRGQTQIQDAFRSRKDHGEKVGHFALTEGNECLRFAAVGRHAH